jgi:hypothetical protein
MIALVCCHEGCGMTFAVPGWWETTRREDHATWFCPNGHRRVFIGKSAVDLAHEALARERAAHDQTQAARDTAERKLATAERRIRRVKVGLCPFCERSFSNLAAHMKCKHGKAKKP